MNYIIKDNVVYRKGTLAHFLDTRDLSINEPTEAFLPKSVNPFSLLYEELLKNNCAIIILQHSEMQYPSDLLYLINELVPSEQSILFYINVDDINTELKIRGRSSVTCTDATIVTTKVPVTLTGHVTVSSLEDICHE